jgi:hypothetical protein
MQHNWQNYCLYILTFTFVESRQKDKETANLVVANIPEFNLLLIFSCMQFWSINVVPRYVNFA